MLTDEAGESGEVGGNRPLGGAQVTRKGGQRSGQDAVGIAHRHPDPGPADVHAEPYPPRPGPRFATLRPHRFRRRGLRATRPDPATGVSTGPPPGPGAGCRIGARSAGTSVEPGPGPAGRRGGVGVPVGRLGRAGSGTPSRLRSPPSGVEQLLHGGQQAGRRVGRQAAALGQLGATAAPPGQRPLDQVGRGEPRSRAGWLTATTSDALPPLRAATATTAGPVSRAPDLLGEGTHVVARRCPPAPRSPPRPPRACRGPPRRAPRRCRAPTGRAASPVPARRRAAPRRSARPGRATCSLGTR